MTYQIYWKGWYHLPWYSRTKCEEDFGTYYSCFAGFSIFQFHWYSS